MIICNHVLEHIVNDCKAMRELYRVLKPGGIAILQVPISYTIEKTFEDSSVISEKDRQLIFGQHDHVRIYGPDYKNILFHPKKLFSQVYSSPTIMRFHQHA